MSLRIQRSLQIFRPIVISIVVKSRESCTPGTLYLVLTLRYIVTCPAVRPLTLHKATVVLVLPRKNRIVLYFPGFVCSKFKRTKKNSVPGTIVPGFIFNDIVPVVSLTRSILFVRQFTMYMYLYYNLLQRYV